MPERGFVEGYHLSEDGRERLQVKSRSRSNRVVKNCTTKRGDDYRPLRGSEGRRGGNAVATERGEESKEAWLNGRCHEVPLSKRKECSHLPHLYRATRLSA